MRIVDERGLFLRVLCAFLGTLGIAATILSSGVTHSAPGTILKDVSNELSVHSSGFRVDRRTGQLVQAVTITNVSDKPINGNLFLVLGNLDPGILVSGHDKSIKLGSFATNLPAIPVVSTSNFRPGDKLTTVLKFTAPQNKRIRYQPRIFQQTTNN